LPLHRSPGSSCLAFPFLPGTCYRLLELGVIRRQLSRPAPGLPHAPPSRARPQPLFSAPPETDELGPNGNPLPRGYWPNGQVLIEIIPWRAVDRIPSESMTDGARRGSAGFQVAKHGDISLVWGRLADEAQRSERGLLCSMACGIATARGRWERPGTRMSPAHCGCDPRAFRAGAGEEQAGPCRAISQAFDPPDLGPRVPPVSRGDSALAICRDQGSTACAGACQFMSGRGRGRMGGLYMTHSMIGDSALDRQWARAAQVGHR
jgi:hypothetical protein